MHRRGSGHGDTKFPALLELDHDPTTYDLSLASQKKIHSQQSFKFIDIDFYLLKMLLFDEESKNKQGNLKNILQYIYLFYLFRKMLESGYSSKINIFLELKH